ncbi:MAG: DUF488 family protein [Bacteroidia bacterium]|nr:DUF488 family protein [Bacteroidia bacterium]
MKPIIRIKQIYEPSSKSDGYRILVDRLWPRGLTKERACIHAWIKNLAPSTPLRRWFRHDPRLWPEFVKRYRAELNRNNAVTEFVESYGHLKQVTLLYAASDKDHTHALALKEYLEKVYEREAEEYDVFNTTKFQ